jgi:hypothetical protein
MAIDHIPRVLSYCRLHRLSQESSNVHQAAEMAISTGVAHEKVFVGNSIVVHHTQSIQKGLCIDKLLTVPIAWRAPGTLKSHCRCFFFASSTASTAAAAELGGGRLYAIGFAIGFSVGRGVGKLDALLVVGVSVLARTAVINVSPTLVY